MPVGPPASQQLLAVLVALAVVAAGCGSFGQDADDVRGPASAGVADLVEEVAPSVVSILAGPGAGSGIIFDSEGLIVTNAHVAPQADDLVVAFADGHRVDAERVAADTRSDIAVLRVDEQGLPEATFHEGLPRVGDAAVAIGSPLGFENSATAGIISGLDRAVPGAATGGAPALVGLIQTDAGLSPGNSGGALVNHDGAVVGMNVAAAAPEGVPAGSIGFAIPASTVVDVAEQLLETGEVEHPYLGVRLAPLIPSVLERFDVGVERGALVLAVEDGSPAAEGGIAPGDVLIGLGDASIDEPGDVLAALRDHGPGETVAVTVHRDDGQQSVDVTLAERPD